MSIPIKTGAEIQAMKDGGRILAAILVDLEKAALPGIKRKELDNLARRLCLKYHVQPSFLGYNGYPAALCVSLDDEVVHGIPDDSRLKAGDLVSLDMGVLYEGFHTDAARSFICGGVKDDGAKRMIQVAEQSFYSAVDLIKNGIHLGDVSAQIQKVGEARGFGVIRMLVGHGIGKKIHEEPHVPNYGDVGTGPILKTGMTIAIEPMFTESGTVDVVLSDDKWTYLTNDHSRAVHFENTVLVTDDGCEILTENQE